MCRACWVVVLLATACKDKAAPGDGDSAVPGGWDGVEIDLDPLALRFGHAVLPPGGLAVGIVDDYDPAVNYDPWNLYDPDLSWAVPDLEWATAERGRWQGDDLVLVLSNGEEVTLARRDGPGLSLTLDHPPTAPYLRVRLASAAGEHLYGLGETFDAADQRGLARSLLMRADTDMDVGYADHHVSVPFLVSSAGWGLGLLTDWPAAVDAAASDPEVVEFAVSSEDPLAFVLFSEDDPRDVVAAWTRLTGLPKLPPTWAFAPMIWRDENSSGAQVLEDALAVRDNDLAFGVMWIDNPWQTSYNSMQPDDRFDDWAGMVDTLHGLGFRWMAWSTPYVEEADPEYGDYEAAGLFPDVPLYFSKFGDLVDLTDEAGMAAWQGRVEATAALGLEGWKLDYGEDLQLGMGTGRLAVTFANGQDERTLHHRFTEYYHRAYGEPYGAADHFLLGRAGAWGTQAVTDCIWPGDLDNDFSRHKVDGAEGGLPAAIRAGVSLSMSGFPCFASDTGGYRGGRANRETIIRWTEYSATLPVMQVGGTEDHNYWLIEGDWDALVLTAGQRYTGLHIRLFPYFQALMVAASTDGTPLLVPPGLLGEPHDDAAFFVGDALYVAPVEEEGAVVRQVDLPAGTWVHWWTGEPYEGSAEVPAPLGEGPLFLRAGAIVPLLRESVRTLSPTDGSVDSWADDPGPLVVRHVPGAGSFQVVDGPLLAAGDGELAIGDLGIYTGASVEVWAPGATRLFVDGEEVTAETDGTWLSGETGAGTVSWE